MFTEDADFVNIYAMHFAGREGIAKQHQMIFEGVYRGSRVTFTLTKVRPIGDDAMIAHLKADLRVPEGPMAGTITALATAVLARDDAGWRIVAFHNTREQAPPGPPR